MAESGSDEYVSHAPRAKIPCVLLVDSDPATARVLKPLFETAGYKLVQVDTYQQAIELHGKDRPCAVLLDLPRTDIMNGTALAELTNRHDAPLVIVMTREATVDAAVSAIRHGAADFIAKPFAPAKVLEAVANILRRKPTKTAKQRTVDKSAGQSNTELIGASVPMRAVYDRINKVAPSPASVFITGESGTGKDMVAQAIHAASQRAGDFIALNCGAIPKDLMESELFGHVKGAFTGATHDRLGAARRAQGGTLFLDELGEMDINLQSKLLRFIQTGEVVAVGGSETHSVNVRFVCATNRDPADAVASGLLREDLFYRLNVIDIEIPPLRDREADIMAIAQHFLERFAAEEGKRFVEFAPETEDLLRAYSWPGNVRELQNVIRKVVVLNDAGPVGPDMLPSTVLGKAMPARLRQMTRRMAGSDEILPLWMIEKEAIETAIKASDGNIIIAAAKLGINPSTIYRKRQSWSRGAVAAE